MRTSSTGFVLLALGLVGCASTVPGGSHAAVEPVRADAFAVFRLDLTRLRASALAAPFTTFVERWSDEQSGPLRCAELVATAATVTVAFAPGGSDWVVRGAESADVAACLPHAVEGHVGRRGTLTQEGAASRVRVGAPPPPQRASLEANARPATVASVQLDLARVPWSPEVVEAMGLDPRERAFLFRDARLDATVDVDRIGRAAVHAAVDFGDDERLDFVRGRLASRVATFATALSATQGARLRATPAPSSSVTAFEDGLAAPATSYVGSRAELAVLLDASAAPAVVALASLERDEAVARARSDRAAREVVAIADAIEAACDARVALWPGLPSTPKAASLDTPAYLIGDELPGAWQAIAYRPSGHQYFSYRADIGDDDYRIVAEADLDADGTTSLILLDARRVGGRFVRDAVFFDHFLE